MYFKWADTLVAAPPGAGTIAEVAARAGVDIDLGCCAGSCGVCEVEVRKIGGGSDGEAVVVRSCVAGVPPGYERIEVDLLSDSIWSVDGYDT